MRVSGCMLCRHSEGQKARDAVQHQHNTLNTVHCQSVLKTKSIGPYVLRYPRPSYPALPSPTMYALQHCNRQQPLPHLMFRSAGA